MFTTADPIGLAGGLNNYQYVKNPTGWVDPLGLENVPMVGGGCQKKGESGSSGEATSRSHDEVKAPKVANNFVNLASNQRTIHILDGDATGGGHLWPGNLGKTPFPEGWSREKIMHEVSDITTDPNLTWMRADGKTDLYYRSGRPARFTVEGVRGGINIKVVLEPAGEGIITAHPKY